MARALSLPLNFTCGPWEAGVGEVRGVEPPELLLAVTFEPDLAAAMALARMRLIALEGAAAAAPALGVEVAPAAAAGEAADCCGV